MRKQKVKNKIIETYEYRWQKIPFKMYKIHSDGGHFIAKPFVKSEFGNGGKKSANFEYNQYFDALYFDALNMKFTYNQLLSYLHEQMLLQFPEIENVNEYIQKRLKQARHNYYNRIKRFKRKANLNYWNYFVTITYDDKKHSETSFRNKLRKCLSNLHTRYGWKYMGVFEFSPIKNRLHFHAIMYIPSDKMVGQIDEIKDFSTAQHKIQITHSNSFFACKFGRNDFEELKDEEIRNGNALEYLTKYLYKTNEKIIYSRGIPTEIFKCIDEKDIAAQLFDFVTKFVLFDDVIDTKRDVMGFKYKQASSFDYLHTRLET